MYFYIACNKGVPAQTNQALMNMKNILEAAGSDMSKVVKCTVLLSSMDNFAAMNPVYAEFFPSDPPARTTFAVAGLPANAMVEIDAICLE
jgi:2-iminobutanoate/2-iminopropanoate deaminase